ncbi:hypothetical protein BN1723_007154 [Verticillium longisporum]|uniref:Uncharacterized protein n=1 Tax=Verticillium longisporum TaxID=100787 RepID=A0A0G4NJN5_VERLO|nr:hypothetical protein BN1708_009932 [Verticillium longisporum]CRK46596.1 hypothetical protein BN1723_007154 [Verticillium longisporum]
MADQAATRRGRDALKQALLVGAYLLGIVATAIPVLLIFAGSWLVNDEKDASGPIRLALSKLSIASFDGIIPDPNNKGTYLLTMHLFPRALGWEYPSAPSRDQTAGIVNPTRGTLYLPTDFVTIGRALDLDPSAWGCFPPVWNDPCENPFFAAFRRQFPYEGTPDAWTVFLLSALVACAAAIAAVELAIAFRPSLLRCQCYFAALKRVCPCPRGTRHEIERLNGAFWDRYRLWMWPVVPVMTALTCLNLAVRGWMLLAWLDRWTAQGDDVGDVRPRFGAAFVALSWTATAAGLGAVLCVLARLLLAQRTSWIDQQGAAPGLEDTDADAHGQRHVGLEEPAASTGLPDAQLKGYSDADPDAPLQGRAAEAEASTGPPRNA